ncbi:TSUP family transporter [Helicobacter winghamensis]|uniref:TSUP family transporter n=1 Tax=Helicobacter winghamensis TaxID=157268 RepID=UPI0001A28861|nr:TSUP family transporter [Helicobacter winghamensis]EEO25545.1 hypothetical protein HWAG_00337 [Helicobacter winghamensis ATCC BAA-430]PKT78036.1 hypothetical protein BCM34_02150 [Helicobacter winghamensis]PKT78564.1 hypothetical protein BCM35_00440 [Helicobacter winghamensis]QOQ97944.1 TSUP family transporter [Helicobacter winghamensis]
MQELIANFDFYMLLLLFVAAFVAGFIDSIAGGGGMITIPALLLAGISPLQALATNKLQSSFGSFSATLQFYKKGYINLKSGLPFAVIAFVFSAVGTISVQYIEVEFLSKVLPFLILIFGLYFLFSPSIKEVEQTKKLNRAYLSLAIAAVGFYDGFFGPGTGSFFMLALIVIGGFNVIQSLGQAKLYNFSTNLASLIFFALGGHMLWSIGLLMALGQFIGANLGSKMAMRYGIRIVKPLVVGISFLMAAKLLYEQF